jgi:uncharacterized protein YceH (UPF0502 family)
MNGDIQALLDEADRIARDNPKALTVAHTEVLREYRGKKAAEAALQRRHIALFGNHDLNLQKKAARERYRQSLPPVSGEAAAADSALAVAIDACNLLWDKSQADADADVDRDARVAALEQQVEALTSQIAALQAKTYQPMARSSLR